MATIQLLAAKGGGIEPLQLRNREKLKIEEKLRGNYTSTSLRGEEGKAVRKRVENAATGKHPSDPFFPLLFP